MSSHLILSAIYHLNDCENIVMITHSHTNYIIYTHTHTHKSQGIYILY